MCSCDVHVNTCDVHVNTCDAHVIHMWCSCGVHVMSHVMFMWFSCDVHVMSHWCSCDFHVMFMWCHIDITLMFMWFSCDVTWDVHVDVLYIVVAHSKLCNLFPSNSIFVSGLGKNPPDHSSAGLHVPDEERAWSPHGHCSKVYPFQLDAGAQALVPLTGGHLSHWQSGGKSKCNSLWTVFRCTERVQYYISHVLLYYISHVLLYYISHVLLYYISHGFRVRGKKSVWTPSSNTVELEERITNSLLK